MRRYHDASSVVSKFETLIEKEIENIIRTRKEWGKIVPRFAKIRNRPKERLKLFADFDALYQETPVKIRLGIIWKDVSKKETYYYISTWGESVFDDIWKSYESDIFSSDDHSLGFFPDVADVNIERDFNVILDEFIRII